jgi:hypothetical protein
VLLPLLKNHNCMLCFMGIRFARTFSSAAWSAGSADLAPVRSTSERQVYLPRRCVDGGMLGSAHPDELSGTRPAGRSPNLPRGRGMGLGLRSRPSQREETVSRVVRVGETRPLRSVGGVGHDPSLLGRGSWPFLPFAFAHHNPNCPPSRPRLGRNGGKMNRDDSSGTQLSSGSAPALGPALS